MNKKQRTAENKKKKENRPVIKRDAHGKTWTGCQTNETRKEMNDRFQVGDFTAKKTGRHGACQGIKDAVNS